MQRRGGEAMSKERSKAASLRGSPAGHGKPVGASSETQIAPFVTSEPSKEMQDVLRELLKTGEWSYVLTKWSDMIDRELVAAGLVERRAVNLGWIRVAYRAVKAPKSANGGDERRRERE